MYRFCPFHSLVAKSAAVRWIINIRLVTKDCADKSIEMQCMGIDVILPVTNI